MFSGGACSWATAMRVKERHPGEEIVLLFADTLIEDEDLYRFLIDAERQLGLPVTRISDGRTPWEIFKHKRWIGNTQLAHCSLLLKKEMLDKWIGEHCDPARTIQHFGADWTEMHRVNLQRKSKPGYRIEAYMTEAPYMTKQDILRWMSKCELRPQRLYEMGFHHGNCGGFCVKAGQAHFALLLKTMPERYAFHENKERELRAFLDKDNTILKGQTLEAFRLKIEAQEPIDEFDFGGCGCALE